MEDARDGRPSVVPGHLGGQSEAASKISHLSQRGIALGIIQHGKEVGLQVRIPHLREIEGEPHGRIVAGAVGAPEKVGPREHRGRERAEEGRPEGTSKEESMQWSYMILVVLA